jgi:CBS domain-containing protein
MYEFLEYRVRDAMTFRPITVAATATLGDVERVFEASDHECLPVVEDRDRLLGVITKLDFLRAFSFTRDSMIPRYAEIMKEPVARVMTREPLTVVEDMPLTRVLQWMVSTRHKSFPVVRDDLLLGMISRRDVLRALHRAAGGDRPRDDAVSND